MFDPLDPHAGARRLAVALATVVFVGLLVFFWPHKAHSQHGASGHGQFHADYSHWLQPNSTTSCCNAREKLQGGGFVGDCYPTEFKLISTKDGPKWRARLAEEDGPGLEKDGWITIPDEKIIREHNPDPSGVTGHLCINQYGYVLCAVPPTGAM